MIELIMLCGQGSCGKSYFAQHNYSKSNIVSMDDIVSQCKDIKYEKNKHFSIYLKKIQEKIDKEEKIIVLDFSQDTISSRKNILDFLNFKNREINFSAINFMLDEKDIINFHTKRVQRELSKKEKETIIMTKRCFQPATANEFKMYNFNSIKIYKYKI